MVALALVQTTLDRLGLPPPATPHAHLKGSDDIEYKLAGIITNLVRHGCAAVCYFVYLVRFFSFKSLAGLETVVWYSSMI